MQRDYTPPTFESFNKLTCGPEDDLKFQIPRRVWPRVEMCYGKTQKLSRDASFCNKASVENLENCAAGFEAQFNTNLEVRPKFSAVGSIDKLRGGPKAYIDVEVSLGVTWTTGVSVRAGGKCKHTEKRYLPELPQQIAIRCFFPGCVAVYIQGKAEMSLDGTLAAGATAVHHTEFEAKGNIRFGVGESNPALSYESNCGNRRNCFQYPSLKSGWRAEAWGEMWGQIGVKVGPVITVMVTPGLWASITPWISADASMYGGMKYKNSGGNLDISDEVFAKYKMKQTDCDAVSVPIEENAYNVQKPITRKSSKTNAQGQQVPEDDALGSGTFLVAEGGPGDNCFAAALSLRAGVDMFGGLIPESMANNLDAAKNYIKDRICGKAKNRRHLDEAASPFDEGFEAFTSPNSVNAFHDSELDAFNKCLQESELEITPDGQPSSRFFNPFNPRSYCRWGVDKVFQFVAPRLKTGEQEMYCKDFKYYTSETCANKVGCAADLQLFPPPNRPAPGNYRWRDVLAPARAVFALQLQRS